MSSETQDILIHSDPDSAGGARPLQDIIDDALDVPAVRTGSYYAQQVAKMRHETRLLQDSFEAIHNYLFGEHRGEDADTFLRAQHEFARVLLRLVAKGQRPGTLMALCARHVMTREHRAEKGDRR